MQAGLFFLSPVSLCYERSCSVDAYESSGDESRARDARLMDWEGYKRECSLEWPLFTTKDVDSGRNKVDVDKNRDQVFFIY